MSSMPRARQFERRARRRSGSRASGRTRRARPIRYVSCASVPAYGNTQRSVGIRRCVGLLRRRQDQRGALVDHVVGVHQLGVRPADHSVARAGLRDLLGGNGFPVPRVRVGLRDGAEAGPQLADPAAMFVGRLPRRDPQRLLEHRVDVRRPVQVDPQFDGPRQLEVVVGALRGPAPRRPAWCSPACRPPRAPSCGCATSRRRRSGRCRRRPV